MIGLTGRPPQFETLYAGFDHAEAAPIDEADVGKTVDHLTATY